MVPKTISKVRHKLISLLIFIVALYMLISGAIYVLQDKLIFFPSRLDPLGEQALREFEINLENDGEQLHGWFIPHAQPDAPLLIYFGGNAEEVSWSLLEFQNQDLTAHLLAINYRGYGHSTGRPSEKALFSDGLAIVRAADQILQQHSLGPSRKIAMGRSIGSGVAVYLADEVSIDEVILVTAMDSIASVGQAAYPIFPVGALIKHRFDSLKRAPDLNTPVLFIVGEQDRIIPPRHARRLYDAWGGPKELVEIEGRGHNNIDDSTEYWDAVRRYLNED